METQKLNSAEIKFISNEAGERTDVILPYEKYIELLEDLEDLKAIIQANDEKSISHEDLKKELADSGVLNQKQKRANSIEELFKLRDKLEKSSDKNIDINKLRDESYNDIF